MYPNSKLFLPAIFICAADLMLTSCADGYPAANIKPYPPLRRIRPEKSNVYYKNEMCAARTD